MGTYDEMDASEIEASAPQNVCVRLDPWPLYWYEADTPFSEIAAFERAIDAAGTCQEVA